VGGTAELLSLRRIPIAQDRAQRINGEINAPEIRLVGVEGEQLGIVAIADAIAHLAEPPVCRIMDFGKFKYREAKRQHEARLKLKQIQVKEVKFRPGTDEGDYKIKLRNLIRFLGEGDKAKVTLRFRGREMAHQEFGIRLLERIRGDLEPHSVVEQFPRLEGRQMVMLLAPKKVAVTKHHSNKPEAGKSESQKASPPESTAVGSK
jgi:translation initiation factor IF-3